MSAIPSGPFIQQVTKLSKSFDTALNNVNFNMRNNGELRILKILSEHNPKCIFDVGANTGEYTLLASELCPQCIIHSFEIVPETFNQLVNNVNAENVRLNNVGLSDQAGKLDIHISRSDSSTATAFKIEGMRFHDDYYADGDIHPCEVTTGFNYMKENKIEEIDLLKVDVEGMDYRVLSGFRDFLGRSRIVQFEYGVFNIASRDLLVDFYRLLTNHGFIVGKLMPRGALFCDYHFSMEDFYGNNYLAVNTNEHALISKLRL